MQIDQLKPIIEAALLASTQPMTVHQLGDLFNEGEEVDPQQIAQALESLTADCEGRGIELKEVASGFRYQVRQDVHPWISRSEEHTSEHQSPLKLVCRLLRDNRR